MDLRDTSGTAEGNLMLQTVTSLVTVSRAHHAPDARRRAAGATRTHGVTALRARGRLVGLERVETGRNRPMCKSTQNGSPGQAHHLPAQFHLQLPYFTRCLNASATDYRARYYHYYSPLF